MFSTSVFRDLVLAIHVQFAQQAPQVEAVQFLKMFHVDGPQLMAIQEIAEHAGLLDAHRNLLSEVWALGPDSLVR